MKVQFVLTFILSMPAHGSSQDLLIEKFRKVHQQLAPADTSRVGVTLRLADLLSERARTNSIKELDSGCVDCTAGVADRNEALKLYSSVIDNVELEQKGKILLHMAHLSALNGKENEAIKTFNALLINPESQALKGEILTSLGEINYRARRWDAAMKNFDDALKIPEVKQRGFAMYRKAWCQYHLGRRDEATQLLLELMSQPQWLSRNGTGQMDESFAEEVSRDLTTFMAASKSIDLDRLYQLSPKDAKLPNLFAIASELERVGNKPSALSAWKKYQALQTDVAQRIEAGVHILQMHLDTGDRLNAHKEHLNVLDQWTLSTQGEELKIRLRNFLKDWVRAEKDSPSEELLISLKRHSDVFDKDYDSILLTAVTLKGAKNYRESSDYFLRAARLKGTAEQVEVVLLGAIEVAEISKDIELRQTAYESYLALTQKNQKKEEVSYQKVRLMYEGEKYSEAAPAFLNLIMSLSDATLKQKSADLALDSLVLAKKPNEIPTYIGKIIQVAPQLEKQLIPILRKSEQTEVAALINSGQIDQNLWQRQLAIPLEGADSKELAAYWKNRLILAEKLKDVNEALQASEMVIRYNPQPDDQVYAWRMKAWGSEMRLDFQTALQSLKKLPKEKDEDLLHLAMFADLSGSDSEVYLKEFLRISKDSDKKAAVAFELIQKSKGKNLDRYSQHLRDYPQLYGSLILNLYSDGFQKIPKLLPNDPSITVIKRDLLIKDFEKAYRQRVAINPARLAPTLKQKVAWVQKLETFAEKAIQMQDWMAQVITLAAVKTESHALYQEIMSLPVPSDLNEAQQSEYMTLLAQQSSPFLAKAQNIEVKLNEFLASASELQKLAEVEFSSSVASLLQSHLKVLQPFVPDTIGLPQIKIAKARTVKPPSEYETVRRKVLDEPWNTEHLNSLLKIEKEMGRKSMVAYLEGRIKALEQGAKE